MSEVTRIKNQLHRALVGEAWHGPGVMETLEGLTAEQAAARPDSSAHTIWEIVLHLAATNRLVRRRLAGEPAVLEPEEDWPSMGTAGAWEWTAALEELKASFLEVNEALGTVDEENLDKAVVEGFSSTYVTLHGLTQHVIYHTGQIALLRKMSRE